MCAHITIINTYFETYIKFGTNDIVLIKLFLIVLWSSYYTKSSRIDPFTPNLT